MVDDQGVDRAFGGLELEAELLFKGGEDRDDIGAALLRGDIVGRDYVATRGAESCQGRNFDMAGVAAGHRQTVALRKRSAAVYVKRAEMGIMGGCLLDGNHTPLGAVS